MHLLEPAMLRLLDYSEFSGCRNLQMMKKTHANSLGLVELDKWLWRDLEEMNIL